MRHGGAPRRCASGLPSTTVGHASVVSAQTERKWELRDRSKTATLFDALVRNTRGEASPQELVERLLKRWRVDPTLVIGVRPTRLCVDDLLVEIEADERSWTFFAFMSGLRSVGITSDTGPADLQRLAQRLAELRLDVDAAQRFRDWAWEEDGEGLTLVVTRTFSEVFEQASTSFDPAATMLAAVRGDHALPLSGGVLADPSDLDRAALRPEYEVSLLDYHARVDRREHEVTSSVLEVLGRDASTTLGWAMAEFNTIVASAALRNALPPSRVARRLIEVWHGPKPQRAPAILEQLRKEDEPYAARVVSVLTPRAIGRALLDNTVAPLSGCQEGLLEWLATEDALAVEVARALLDEALESDDASVDRLLADVLAGPDAGVFIEAVARPELHPDQAAWVAARIRVEQLEALLARLSNDAQAAALCERSVSDIEAHRERMLGWLDSEQARDKILRRLTERDGAESRALLCEILRAIEDKPWNARLAALCCHQVRATKEGEVLLVAIARSTKANNILRVAALRGLSGAPELLAEAARWRFRELLAPGWVRAAFRDARRGSVAP